MTIDVLTDISTVNLHGQGADLAVRLTRPSRGNLKVRRVGVLAYGLYGSAAYIESRPECAEQSPFLHDSFIGWVEAFANLPAASWLNTRLQGRALTLRTTTLSAQVQAVLAGIGLAVLPNFLAKDAGLEKIPMEMDVEQSIWLVVHSDLSSSRRVRMLADHLVSSLQNPESGLIEKEASFDGVDVAM